LPLEPDYPPTRIELMLQEAKPTVILTTGPIFSTFLAAAVDKEEWDTWLKASIVYLDSPIHDIAIQEKELNGERNSEGIIAKLITKNNNLYVIRHCVYYLYSRLYWKTKRNTHST
jgi:hypothetical protein